DGVRGTDRKRRGPLRLTASKTATPSAVRLAALSCFAVAGVAGLALAVAVDLRLLVVGVICVAGAWFYSGGRRPYGYAGYGELAVLFFFGFVGTVGSAYVQGRPLPAAAWWGSLVAGLPACAVLVANNLRDIESDGAAGKRTLAVRLGARTSARLYTGLVVGAFVAVLPIGVQHPSAFLALVALVFALGPLRLATRGTDPRSLVRLLVLTVRLAAALAVLLTVGLALA
ncbi:MAG: 1,4-dihydroxy-2-naphthoate octaprenyltransferase, partial [Acidimicrobiales bacterium]|nr:1,4-dihydroxy-2-naphthoate octaprenyltransferase [Acidimicrobiales bacterium]